MVTNYPRPIALKANAAEDGFGARVAERVRRAFCGLHGHDTLLQFERNRMFLRCVSCGHESPGWHISDTRPKALARIGTRRPQLGRHFVGARRIA